MFSTAWSVGLALIAIMIVDTGMSLAREMATTSTTHTPATIVAPVMAPPQDTSTQPQPPMVAQATIPASSNPTKVKVGLYVTQLYDIDIPNKSFNITFWSWFLHDNQEYDPIKTVEIVNAKSSSVKYEATTHNGATHWVQGKYSATVIQNWNIAKYPFDRQFLHVYIEDGNSDASAIEFVADTEDSKVDKMVTIPGWKMESFNVQVVKSAYDTTYGDPHLSGQSNYSRLVATLVMQRQGWRLFLTSYLGFIVAFLLVSITYFMTIDCLTTPRFSMNVGAIFSSVGNTISLNHMLTESVTFSLSDGIEASTFLCILLSIGTAAFWRTHKDSQPLLAKQTNRIVGILSVLGYLVFNGVMLFTG